MDLMIPECLNLEQKDSVLRVQQKINQKNKALSGTIGRFWPIMSRACQGFSYELEIIGVGYRAQTKGKVLNLALGYSHPVDFLSLMV